MTDFRNMEHKLLAINYMEIVKLKAILSRNHVTMISNI